MVTTVILDRTTADTLADTFMAFEVDDTARVAVLWGAGGDFSTGIDFAASGRGNRLAYPAKHSDPLTRDAPMGPTRMHHSKPVIAAVAGQAAAVSACPGLSGKVTRLISFSHAGKSAPAKHSQWVWPTGS